MGVQLNKNIFKTAITIPSITPIHKTSVFLNSKQASENCFHGLSFELAIGLFSPHNIALVIIAKALKPILIQKGAYIPYTL